MRLMRWFLFILGLTLGFIFGVYYAWEISPIDPREAKPSNLEEHFQVEYKTLIALAYVNTGNLSRATRRLDALAVSDTAETIKALAQQHLAESRSEEEVLALAQLASAISNPARRTPTAQGIPSEDTPIPAPIMTPPRSPAPTLTSTPIPAYRLRSREKICDTSIGSPLVQIVVFDALGNPVPGVEIRVLWDEGEDHFFTGLKPEYGPGYGDFAMSADIIYTILIAGSDQAITGIEAGECISDKEEYLGSWLFSFEEP